MGWGTKFLNKFSCLYMMMLSIKKLWLLFFEKLAKIAGSITFERRVSNFLFSWLIFEPLQKVYLSLQFGYEILSESFKKSSFRIRGDFFSRSLCLISCLLSLISKILFFLHSSFGKKRRAVEKIFNYIPLFLFKDSFNFKILHAVTKLRRFLSLRLHSFKSKCRI